MTSIIDPVATAGLVSREVRTSERNGTPTKVAVARRTYAAERADVWSAITDPERLPRWFLPISGELREGGRYQLEGNAGGVIERCQEPERFAVTWEYGGQMSWLEVHLAEAGDGTTLELVHEAEVDPEFWTQYGPGATGVGWDLALMGLGLYVGGGPAMDPAAAERWSVSPEGVEFVRHASTGWAEASIADGEDPAQAHEAAERTLAFYTTPPSAPEG